MRVQGILVPVPADPSADCQASGMRSVTVRERPRDSPVAITSRAKLQPRILSRWRRRSWVSRDDRRNHLPDAPRALPGLTVDQHVAPQSSVSMIGSGNAVNAASARPITSDPNVGAAGQLSKRQ